MPLAMHPALTAAEDLEVGWSWRCFLPPDAEGQLTQGDTNSGPHLHSQRLASSILSRPTPSPCHGLGPHQALASSSHGTSDACRRRDRGARVSSQPSPRHCLVSWHHRLYILGLRQRACPRVSACARCDASLRNEAAASQRHHEAPLTQPALQQEVTLLLDSMPALGSTRLRTITAAHTHGFSSRK